MRRTFQLKHIMLAALICALAVSTYRAHQAASRLSKQNQLLCAVQRRLPSESIPPVQFARLPVRANGYILFRVQSRRSTSLVGRATDSTRVREISLPVPRNAKWLGICAQNVDASDNQNVAILVGGRNKRIQVPRLNEGIALPSIANGRLPIELGRCTSSTGRTIEFVICP